MNVQVSNETRFLSYLGDRTESIFSKDDEYKQGYLDALNEVYTVYNSFIVLKDDD